MSYVRTLTICLLLVYFVSAAGCHCFDFRENLIYHTKSFQQMLSNNLGARDSMFHKPLTLASVPHPFLFPVVTIKS